MLKIVNMNINILQRYFTQECLRVPITVSNMYLRKTFISWDIPAFSIDFVQWKDRFLWLKKIYKTGLFLYKLYIHTQSHTHISGVK